MTRTRQTHSTLFGDMSVERFLKDVWRRQPLLVRQAVPDRGAAIARAALVDLARRDDVEARLVTRSGGTWSLARAPLTRIPRARRDWTLLVQGANHYFAQLDALMRRFAFLPYTRLDDVMVSFATHGGGVGAHFDSYDVFLIQAQGERTWRISAQTDLELVEGLPLKILRRFKPEQEWVLGPGDMLYLPPNVAHEGVAIGDCMTYSVGFRAPTFQELGREFLFSLADDLVLPGRFSDRTRTVARHPAELDARLLRSIESGLAQIRWSRADIASFAGRFFSEPKPNIYFTAPARMTRARFGSGAAQTGVRLDPSSQMLYRGKTVFINGETLALGGASRAIVAALADHRCLTARACGKLRTDAACLALFHGWYQAGWLALGESDD